MNRNEAAPLIVTALLPPQLQRRLTALRAAHFPPDRNYLAAHVTLFHALPPSALGEVKTALAREAATNPPLAGEVAGVMSLGRGTAIRLDSPHIMALRDRLAERFDGLMTSQDQHRPRLHVTIQNKVAPAAAKALLTALSPEIKREGFVFAGLGLHAYRGGPWEHIADYPFRAAR